MKRTLVFIALVCLVAPQIIQECNSNYKDQKCSLEEKPVCGVAGEGLKQKKQTFANHCLACSRGKSNFTIDGRCESYSEKAIFCSPKESKNKDCPNQKVDKQCGYSDVSFWCAPFPCTTFAINRCKACSIEKIIYTIPGSCPHQGPVHVPRPPV